MKQNEYVKACLDRLIPQLVGLTITGGVVDDSGEYWGFTAKGQQKGKAVERTVFVLADPEGNAPGWLELNDGIEPDAPAHTEWCPACSSEVSYKEPKPFPCPVCGEILLPCSACLNEQEANDAACSECPRETVKKKEVEPC
ncbi:hypothetical protein PDESU_01966 [Pontiella desulfatans]|uniref:Uncharacterized protein n=1 Tax=Pontiella desulfatans TaxID=2750659 RepID=A0A6C2U0R2_PONDE|nr:hypothetical protein [Pontiella desulfatans]VGO13409.1 hypothetical protein PDESU_01966 [Pontiella desulfatans]